jgi:predicted DNA-binding transcriptional regulator AlpA
MSKKVDVPMLLTLAHLRLVGVPFSRAHIDRKMKDTIEIHGKRGKETRILPNPDPFPKARKLGWHRNSPKVWVRSEVEDYLRRHGIECKLDTMQLP